nr:hypothetical protein GCM10010200_081940 [Actinomadura rugatobispora]
MGTKPWRLMTLERALTGRPATVDAFVSAVGNAAEGARPLMHNAYRPALLPRAPIRAFTVLRESR